MDDIKQYNRGSVWRKWDLHVHSPCTFLNNGFDTKSIDDFVMKVYKSGVAAVGLTNYFRFADLELGEIKKKLEMKGIIVFPTIEFRTQPPNKDKEEMHLHVLFSDALDAMKITSFLGRLETVDQKYCKNLTKEQIKTTSISFDKLRETLDRDRDINHMQDYLIIACSRGQGSLRPSANHSSREHEFAIVVDKFSDILFGNSCDVGFFLNKEKDRYKDAKAKPVLLCSDAHNLDDVCTKFTWIKADTSFEGLKQTLHEPKERVLIQERNPGDTKPQRLVIDHATYKISGEKEKSVYFNSDLNCIIGVRGSGKSTFLKNIAQKIGMDEFGKRDKKAPYPLKDFKVVWGDGVKDSGTVESPKNIFYIPQGYLSALAYDDGERVRERDAFLTRLLKKNELFANAIRSFEDFVSRNKVHIDGLIEKLITSNESIKESAVLLKRHGAKVEIDKEIGKNKVQIEKYIEFDISGKEVNDYSEARKVVKDSRKAVGVLKQDEDILTSLKKTGVRLLISDQEFSMLSYKRQELIRNVLQRESRVSLETLIDEQIVGISADIAELNKVISDKENVARKLEGKIKKSKVLMDLTKELAHLEETVDSIKKLSDKLEKAKVERFETIEALVGAYGNFESQQSSTFRTIKFGEKFSFLKVDVVASFNTEQLKTFVEKNINTRDTSQNIKLVDGIMELFGDAPRKISTGTLKELIIGLVDEKVIIKVGAGSIDTVIAQLLKNRFEIDYLNSVKTIDGQTHFKDMTGGQKAISLLELIFRFDDVKYPILIDQPEDDLDVGGIASDLVNFITAEKQDRQVIIVTHNASLVICADSENTIVSNIENVGSSKYDFSYVTGSIENPRRRTDIIKVLEGGESALNKRIAKLNVRVR